MGCACGGYSGRITPRIPLLTREAAVRTAPSQPTAQATGLRPGRTWDLKQIAASADHNEVQASRLPVKAGPVPDRLTIWPVDDGRYGLDATFHGASGYQRAEHHRDELTRLEVPHSFRQELDDGWTLRFGPLPAVDIAAALASFVY